MSLDTPKNVAFRAAIITSVTVCVVYLIAELLLDGSYPWLSALAILVFTFGVSYLIFYQHVEKFIYQKLRVVYKTIHNLKRGKGKPKQTFDMNEDVLEKVNQDVQHWADDKINEIRDLRKKDTFRKEFIGNLAHELKTPVFNIQGYILTLLEGALEDPDNNRKFLLKAAKGVDRISALLEDLDSITKIESENFNLKKQKFDIVELTKDMFESLEHTAKKRDIHFKLKNPNGKPVMVNADRQKIGQVLTNLLVNSINYGIQDGETQVRFFDMDENVLIEVADNGLGIEEEHLPRIFERFYRVDKSRSRHQGGSGLGLAIVKHIVESHGQAINVRSKEDVGSTFSFTLEKA
jgi:two-component system phosphate regulon sensor histidine kinase PhoR